MRYSLLLMWLIIGVLRSSSQTVLPVYTMPDTVCRGEVINITNLTQGGTTYEWNFCLQRPSQSISGANIGSPAGIKNRPHGIQVFKEGNNWVGFVGNDAGAFVAEPLVRFNFGNSLLNTPTVTDLPNFGVLYNPAYIRFFKEGNTWYALAYTGRNVVSGFDLHVVLLSFGNSLLTHQLWSGILLTWGAGTCKFTLQWDSYRPIRFRRRCFYLYNSGQYIQDQLW